MLRCLFAMIAVVALMTSAAPNNAAAFERQDRFSTVSQDVSQFRRWQWVSIVKGETPSELCSRVPKGVRQMSIGNCAAMVMEVVGINDADARHLKIGGSLAMPVAYLEHVAVSSSAPPPVVPNPSQRALVAELSPQAPVTAQSVQELRPEPVSPKVSAERLGGDQPGTGPALAEESVLPAAPLPDIVLGELEVEVLAPNYELIRLESRPDRVVAPASMASSSGPAVPIGIFFLIIGALTAGMTAVWASERARSGLAPIFPRFWVRTNSEV